MGMGCYTGFHFEGTLAYADNTILVAHTYSSRNDHGETELHGLCNRVNMSFGLVKDAFRKLKTSKGLVVRQEFKKLQFAVDTIPAKYCRMRKEF